MRRAFWSSFISFLFVSSINSTPILKARIFPLLKEVKPDGAGEKLVVFKIWRQIDAQLTSAQLSRSSRRVEDMEAVTHDLAHQKAGAVLGNVNDTAGKGACKLATAFAAPPPEFPGGGNRSTEVICGSRHS